MSAPAAPWRLVAAREIAVKLRDKNFILSTVFTLVVMIGSFALPTLIAGEGKEYSVAVVGDAGRPVVEQALGALEAEGDDVALVPLTVPDRAAAEQAVKDGDADAALVQQGDAWALLTDGEADTGLSGPLGDAVRTQALTANAAKAGTTLQELAAGTELVPVDLSVKEGEKSVPDFVIYLLGMAFAALFYMASVLFGVQIANSVVEEKQSRIVEILAAAIPLRQLLMGKVLGNTAIAFGQIVLLAGAALIGLRFIRLPEGFQLPDLTRAILWYVPFFVVGFLALACIWAAAGALAARAEDVQSTSMPLTMVLVVLFILSLNAEGPLRAVMSFVPIASTFLMPIRIIAGEVTWWEPLVALLITLAFCALAIRFGERLYQRALLHTSGSLTWRKALALRD